MTHEKNNEFTPSELNPVEHESDVSTDNTGFDTLLEELKYVSESERAKRSKDLLIELLGENNPSEDDVMRTCNCWKTVRTWLREDVQQHYALKVLRYAFSHIDTGETRPSYEEIRNAYEIFKEFAQNTPDKPAMLTYSRKLVRAAVHADEDQYQLTEHDTVLAQEIFQNVFDQLPKDSKKLYPKKYAHILQG